MSGAQLFHALIEPMPWREDAACAPHNIGENVNHLFFPEGEVIGAASTVAPGICSTCPVIAECGQQDAKVGVWGGVDRGAATAARKAASMAKSRAKR